MAGHISRLAERYTPIPTNEREEMTKGQQVQQGIEAIFDKLRKNVLEKINSYILRRIRAKYIRWRANSGMAAEKIAGRLGDEMEKFEYDALLRQGASRILHELLLRALHRKLEVAITRWRSEGKV